MTSSAATPTAVAYGTARRPKPWSPDTALDVTDSPSIDRLAARSPSVGIAAGTRLIVLDLLGLGRSDPALATACTSTSSLATCPSFSVGRRMCSRSAEWPSGVGLSDHWAKVRGVTRHTTCYLDTFITVALDSTALVGTEPPRGPNPSVAARTYAMIASAPYAYTSDDVIFTVWADRNGVPETERPAARDAFFSKGQPCLRASDLGKRYGWGVHSDAQGRVALYPIESPEYESYASGSSPRDGTSVAVTAAMRSSRASRTA